MKTAILLGSLLLTSIGSFGLAGTASAQGYSGAYERYAYDNGYDGRYRGRRYQDGYYQGGPGIDRYGRGWRGPGRQYMPQNVPTLRSQGSGMDR